MLISIVVPCLNEENTLDNFIETLTKVTNSARGFSAGSDSGQNGYSYPNIGRSSDKSSWSFTSLMKYAMDGITAFSSAPLIIASALGSFLCLLALIAVLFIVIRTLLFDDPVSGCPSLACIIIFLGGIQLFCLGIVGQYLAKVYDETKHRPHYVIQESNLSAENQKSISE